MMGIRNKLIKCFLPLFLVATQTSASNCNCDGYFCVNDREYQLCQNGEVAGDPIPCDEGIACRNETEIDCSRQPLCQKRQESQNEENASANFVSLCQGLGYYPDPENCERFYVCTGYGVGKLMPCPTGMYYNERRYICTPNKPERCSSTIDTVTTQTEQYVTDPPLESDGMFDCPGVGLFADPDNCQRYYQCDEAQRSFLRDCAEETYFDEELEDCVSRIPERCRGADAESSTLGDVSEVTTDAAQTTQTSQTDGTTVYPTDDTQSTIQERTTDNGEVTTDNVEVVTTIQTEPTDGTTTTTAVTTTASPPKYTEDFVCPGEGYFPDPVDCQHYYVCDVVDRPMRVSCPEGTYYVEEFEFCSKDIPERCRDSDAPPATSTPKNEEPTTEKVSTTVPDESGDRTEGMTTTTAQTPSDFACPDEGLFPDPEDCHRYYVCTDLEQFFSVACPNDTYFDAENTFCTDEIPERCREPGKPSMGEVSSTSTEQPTTAETGITETSTSNSDITTPKTPEGGFVCPGGGYFADPNNCQNYFVCFNAGDSFVVIPVACPENTYFDEEREFCTSDIPERCSEQSGDSTKSPPKYDDEFICPGEGYYPDPKSCSRYYMCYVDFAIPLACPNGTYFDDENDFCTEQIPERCRTSDDDVNRPTTPHTDRPTTEKNNNRFECPGEGYYPDPENCRDYFICYNWGSAIPVSCPDNTYFDPESSFCTKDIPERCRATERPQNEVTSTTPSVPTEDEFICPEEGYYPNPKDCQSYYICYGGNRFILLSCPENTFYDDESSFCRSNMPDRCRVTERPTEDNTYATTTPKNDIDTTSAPEEDVFRCPGEGYYPDTKDCHRYYACLGFGPPLRLTCPDDTYFDGKGFCTLDRPERCTPQYATKPPQEEDTDKVFKCPGSGQFSDPKDCRKYWICFSKNFGYPVQCPNDTYYDADSTYCTSHVPERCKGPEDTNFICPGEGYFANPVDCHAYYVCYSPSMSMPMRCPGNSYYHQSMEGCAPDMPETCKKPFICPRAGFFPDPRDCSRYYVCNFWGDSFSMKCERGRYFDERIRGCSSEMPLRCQSVLPPLQNGFTCPNTGYFADPVNCSVYHICNTLGRHYTESCPPKMYYHEDTRSCSPIKPDRCIYLEARMSTLCSEGSSEGKPVLSDTGNVLNNTFVCPDKGLFPDPYDCHKFYVCYGQPRQVTCWGKTYYSEETQQCEEDMPERCKAADGTTLPPSTPTSTPQPEGFVCPDKGLFPDPDDCHRFYVCYGEPRQVTCRNGMYFDDESQQCSEDLPDRCKANGGGNVTPQPTMPPSTSQPGEFICPDKGLFPHPTDCHKFYVCYGDPREVTCWGNTYFDEESQRCVEVMPERCRSNGDGDVTPMPTSQPGEFVCPDEGLFPDPDDCHRFYVCYGEPRQVTCRNGMYFDDESQQCSEDLPDRCKANGGGNVTPQPTMPPSTSQPGEFVCPGQGLFPDPDDCHRFYVCYGEPRQITCRNGMYFDDESEQCSEDLPDRCKPIKDETSSSMAPTTSTTTETPTTTTPKDVFQCRGPGRYPDPLDCQSFYYCNWRQEASHFTCKDSTYFNDITNKCQPQIPDRCRSDDDRETTTTPKPPSAFVCRETGRYPDPEDCLRYYYCSKDDSTPIHYSCPTNQFFDSNKNKCKKIKTGLECPTGNPDRVHSHEDKDDEDDDDEDDDDDDDEDNEDFVCTQVGLFPDPRDCKKFYECTLSLKMKHKTCSGRSYFNERFRYCSIFTTERCKNYGIFW